MDFRIHNFLVLQRFPGVSTHPQNCPLRAKLRSGRRSTRPHAGSICRPAAIPAHPEFLRRRFRTFLPASAGAKPRRVSTVKSEVLFALRHLGLTSSGGYLAPLSPAWMTLWKKLPDKYARTCFSRFFRYCAAGNIDPRDVTDAVTASFLAALETETLVRQPRINHQNLCRAWNRMIRTVPGWPQVRLSVPRYADHYILAPEVFPAAFWQDVDAYLANQALDDPLNLNAPPRALHARTLKAYRYQFRRIASMLVRCGHKSDAITSLAYLAEPNNVADTLQFLLKRAGKRQMTSAALLAELLAQVAKYWAKRPVDDVATIRRYATNVRPPRDGLNSKNRHRLAPLRDERNLTRLFLLPGKISKEVTSRSPVNRRDALLMQHAVALSVLTFAPVRIGNLSRLHMTNDLRWSALSDRGQLVLDIDGAEVKNGQTLSFPLPAECADLIKLYISKYRPLLVAGPNPFLFPSNVSSRPKRADTLGKQLSRLIRQSIGLEVNPHLYRHLVHLVVLSRFPGAYAMISRILGHKSLQTAISNYAGEDIAIAMRAYQQLIADATSRRERETAAR